MNLFRLLQARASAGKPVRVALIGAGKFGSMFLAQVPHTPGLEVPLIIDIDRDRAREACKTVGWDDARIAATTFTNDGARAIAGGAMDVVVEATGNPAVGIRHARAAIAAGKHIVMVNVEADVLAGPLLAEEAREAGVVFFFPAEDGIRDLYVTGVQTCALPISRRRITRDDEGPVVNAFENRSAHHFT